ncbi:MAG: PAS domain-containing protein [Acidobacteria bacterium]|nr:PAS domain-containing protein [Acidobacteriota bacterium]
MPILPTADGSEWLPQWEALFEAMEDGVCVQTTDARIMLVNRAFAEMFGRPPAELIGKTCNDVFGCASDHGQLPKQCARLNSLLTGVTATEEISGRNPGQRLRARVSPVRDVAGQVIAFVMVVRDVTDVALREREQSRIEQIARLGELVAGLAHEIKNPLAGIQGAVDILIQRRLPEDPERAVLENVRHEVNRIDSAIQLLLSRARPRTFNFQPANLADTVQRAVGLGQAIAASATHGRIRVKFISPALPLVLAIDEHQIEDAVLNLILNALDAIAGPGQIVVSVSHDQLNDLHAAFARVIVTDDGCGIPAENLQRIFNPFFTTNAHGTGLGLPAVRRIVRAHGGRVEVTSTVGSGSTFTLFLPYQATPAADEPAISTSE